ncbi:WD40 repeat domain-containing protein [Deinococcus maricopensis]|uniref:WD40 repeat-containing protein n=1 Tax=Deinococcus maricopensis (strain DSM 21211 / LMG 22137 / NRRL B-23946 / LB-34) TaxID=709986 RepID=E8UAG8_DEIML|nr:WD40 repeat domain-containing protein [Deinococcus maricopensis]ADV68057.1 hypothetical protein Deima_2419 [Deinococcus maricopensis DSM 21211]
MDQLTWAPDNRAVLALSDGRIDVFDAATGRRTAQLNTHHPAPCLLTFVPQGLLHTERDPNTRATWLTLRTWPTLRAQWRTPMPCPLSTSADRDGRTLAALLNTQGTVRVQLFDLHRRTPGRTLTRPDSSAVPVKVAVRPDGAEVAAGYSDGWIMVWNSRTGRETWRTRPYAGLSRALTWNPEGTALASSGFGRCRWWRSECTVVSWAGPGGVQQQVLWSSWFQGASSVQWPSVTTLLLTTTRQAWLVRAPTHPD